MGNRRVKLDYKRDWWVWGYIDDDDDDNDDDNDDDDDD